MTVVMTDGRKEELAVLLATLAVSYASWRLAWTPPRLKAEATRFESRRRSMVILWHTFSAAANAYIIFLDEEVHLDLVRGYSRFAHLTFCFGAVTYGIDTVLMAVHPRKTRLTKSVWLVHHVISVALLLLLMHVRMGGFPAACFMISSATHVTSNARWFLQTRSGLKCTPADKALGLVNLVNFFMTAVLPIPFMLSRITDQASITYAELWDGSFRYMHRKCIGGTLLIYVPHVLLFVHMTHREAARLFRAPYAPKRVLLAGKSKGN